MIFHAHDASSYVPQTRISHQGASHTFHNLNIRHSLLTRLLHMYLKHELCARGVPTMFTFILEIMIWAWCFFMWIWNANFASVGTHKFHNYDMKYFMLMMLLYMYLKHILHVWGVPTRLSFIKEDVPLPWCFFMWISNTNFRLEGYPHG